MKTEDGGRKDEGGKHLNKVREMKGVEIGRRSAGRANANGKGRHWNQPGKVGSEPRRDSFADVGRACAAWLGRRGIAMGGMAEVIGRSCAAHRAGGK